MPTREFTHGRGGRVSDTAGREYVDLILGYGPVVLGHAHPEVARAVCAQTELGTLLPGASPLQQQLEDRVRRVVPVAESQLFFKTGSEAIAAAVRIARAATGRARIARVGFHGWHDQVVSPYLSCHRYAPRSEIEEHPAGVPHEVLASLVETWVGSMLDRLPDVIREADGALAAVVVDPVQLQPPFAKTAAEIATACRKTGTLLVLDESKTGFRIAPGGFQDLYDIAADLTVMSKALANGYPLALVAGRAELVALAKPARIKGTYSYELSAMAAAAATLDVLERERASEALAARGTELLGRLNDVISTEGPSGLSAVPYHWPSMPYLFFEPGSLAASIRDRFYERLADAGVLMLRDHMNFVCVTHTAEDVEKVANAVRDVLRSLQ